MNSKNNIPQLRFPGFSGEWEEKRMGDITDNVYQPQTISKEQFTNGGFPVYGANGVIGFFDKYNHETDQILVTCRGASCGTINFSKGKCWITGNAMVVNLDNVENQYNKNFIYYLLENSDLNSIITGSGQPQIVRGPLLSFSIYTPPTFSEQKKIALFLSEFDSLIAAQGEKVDALKEKKRGMMQQMFPQKGETTPRLRFPGFTGEWDYVDGDELFEAISNKNHNSDLPILALTQDQGAVPRDMINYNVIVSDKSVAGYKVVEVDDFIISLRSFQGGIEYSRYKGLCSPAYIVLRKKSKELCSDFYRIYFKSFNYIQDLNKNLEGIRDGKMISYKQFSEIKLPKPSPSEQQKIAECLSAMDDMIASESEKLDALKEHKKGLMQQLFPQPKK